MNKVMNQRIIEEANYIIKTKETLRQVAKVFQVSKSTVHKDMQDRLIYIDNKLFDEVDSILEYHKEIRHLRGGDATKRKYLELEN